MLAGISGATPGSGAAVGDEEKLGRLTLPHAPRNIVSAVAIPRLATVRALRDLTMYSPEQIRGRTRPAAKRKTAAGAMTSSKIRWRSDLVSFKHPIMASPTAYPLLLDRISVKPYSRAHN
jgi:hypothetical protein